MDKNSNNVEPMKRSHGGARAGGGKPKGTKWPSTLAKAEARELVRQKITEDLNTLIDAQMANAVGISHLMIKDPKTGQLKRVTGSAAQIDKAVKNKNAVWIYTKDPNVQAFTDLMNRAIDKPSEHVSISGSDGGPFTIQWQSPEGEEPEQIEDTVIEIEAHDPEKNGYG